MATNKKIFETAIKNFLSQPDLIDSVILENKTCGYLDDRLSTNFDMVESSDLNLESIESFKKLSAEENIKDIFFLNLPDSVRAVIEANNLCEPKKEFEKDFKVISDDLTIKILSRDFVQELIYNMLLNDFGFDLHIAQDVQDTTDEFGYMGSREVGVNDIDNIVELTEYTDNEDLIGKNLYVQVLIDNEEQEIKKYKITSLEVLENSGEVELSLESQDGEDIDMVIEEEVWEFFKENNESTFVDTTFNVEYRINIKPE